MTRVKIIVTVTTPPSKGWVNSYTFYVIMTKFFIKKEMSSSDNRQARLLEYYEEPQEIEYLYEHLSGI